MKKYISYSILFFGAIVMALACTTTSDVEERQYVFVESYIVANRPLPEIQLSTTSPIDTEYRFSENALSGANIQVVLLGENNDDEIIIEYEPTETDGIYAPADRDHMAKPMRTYRLDIDFNHRPEVIRATTTVPDQFEIISPVPDSLIYQSEQQLEITISPVQRVQRQNIFVFSAQTRRPPDVENLTPFYRALVDNEDVTLDELLITSSGLINEGNFDVHPDGTITLQFPWIGVAFYLENFVVTNSVDKNIYDLIRSQQVQLGGGSTISPGEIPNLIYNIEGGIGVFGSLSSDTISTKFVRPPNQ